MLKLTALRQTLQTQQHRQLVVLSGSKNWQQQQFENLFKSHEQVFWITSKPKQADSEQIPLAYKSYGFEPIESKRLPYHLGQEIDGAIIDVHDGISADSLGIVSGMIRAGGLFIVLTPEIKAWQKLNNPEDARFLNTPYSLHQAHKFFTQHLIDCWNNKNVVWLSEESSQISLANQSTSSAPQKTLQKATASAPLPTDDQIKALEKIKSVAFGHRKRPLVITADRGRGKTAALGLAAIDCLLEGKQHVVISASRADQIKTAFNIALQTLKDLPEDLGIQIDTKRPTRLEFHYKNELKTFEYTPPDQLILSPTSADVLMVDEAAHLPTPLLIELLKRHHRMVFATTFHGYEGSGRGFALRFKKHLDQQTPHWKELSLEQPIRWAKADPLEKTIFDTLLLDVQLPVLDEAYQTSLNFNELSYESFTSEQLISHPTMMRQLFALLVQAHYQTSPNDLQQLLNAPNIQIVVAKKAADDAESAHILGAALAIHEGKVNPSKQRAHGHLVPQLLTRHYAQQDFLMLSTLRVMRIAVHPSLQRNGIGINLIQQIEKLALQQRVDYVSSSFGGSDDLLPFWTKLGFWPLHVGVKRDKASGSHNVVVAKAVSAMSRQALALIQNRFQEQFPHLLLESLPHLPAGQVLQIMQTFRFKKTNYGLDKALLNYQSGERPYESISSKLWEWSLQSASKIMQAPIVQQAIWCDKVLKRNDWQQVAHKYHLAGRKGVEKELKEMIDHWLNNQQNRSSSNHVNQNLNPTRGSGSTYHYN